MAEFVIQKIKYGYEGRGVIEEDLSIVDIIFSEADEVVVLPSEYEDEPITLFGFGQAFDRAHEEWADWHHPSKGSDFVPDRYYYDYRRIVFPEYVKKVVIPATVKDICFYVVKDLKTLTVEVDPENRKYASENGIFGYKKS